MAALIIAAVAGLRGGAPDAQLVPGIASRCELAGFGQIEERVTLNGIDIVRPGGFAPVASIPNVPLFCRVQATVKAMPGSLINFEVCDS